MDTNVPPRTTKHRSRLNVNSKQAFPFPTDTKCTSPYSISLRCWIMQIFLVKFHVKIVVPSFITNVQNVQVDHNALRSRLWNKVLSECENLEFSGKVLTLNLIPKYASHSKIMCKTLTQV